MFPLGPILSKDHRTILCAHVGPLTVKFGRILHDGEKDPQQLAVGNLSRVIGDAQRLSVPGGPGADGVVISCRRISSRVPGFGS